MNFLYGLIEKIVFDLGAKLVSWLQALWNQHEQEVTNKDNADKLNQDIKTGVTDAQAAKDEENLINGTKS